MEALPPEVLHCVLGHVERFDIHRVAHVSRRLRGVALANDAFYLTCKIGKDASTEVAFEVLEYVVSHRVPLKIDIYVPEYSIRITAYAMLRVCDLIVSAFPVVVSFSMRGPIYLWERLDRAIRQPAPALRACYICVEQLFDAGIPGPGYELPVDLFAGYAPRLRILDMWQVPKEFEFPVGLQNATTVILSFSNTTPSFELAKVFPQAERLVIQLGSPRTTFGVDCRGAESLKRLDIAALDSVSHFAHDVWERLGVARIPLVTLTLIRLNFPASEKIERHPLFRGLVGPLVLLAEYHTAYITIGTLHGGKQLMIHTGSQHRQVFRLVIETFGTRLVEMEIDQPFFGCLLSTPSVALPNLELLRLHRAKNMGLPVKYHVVQCDQLAVVELVDGKATAFTPMFINELVHMLGQDRRPRDTRPRLELLGDCGLTQDHVLDHLFSSVGHNRVARTRLPLAVPDQNDL